MNAAFTPYDLVRAVPKWRKSVPASRVLPDSGNKLSFGVIPGGIRLKV